MRHEVGLRLGKDIFDRVQLRDADSGGGRRTDGTPGTLANWRRGHRVLGVSQCDHRLSSERKNAVAQAVRLEAPLLSAKAREFGFELGDVNASVLLLSGSRQERGVLGERRLVWF